MLEARWIGKLPDIRELVVDTFDSVPFTFGRDHWVGNLWHLEKLHLKDQDLLPAVEKKPGVASDSETKLIEEAV